jgi:membrane protease YdiL (CAAX protease family)
MITVRWFRGLPLLPYQPRRPVPWTGIDVVLIVLVYVFIPPLVMRASGTRLDVPAVAQSKTAEDAPLDTSHPLQRVLSKKSPTAWPVAICAVLTIVIIPITEELVFRLLLQGWLESVERQLRRRVAWLRRIVVGAMPVTTVAILFAAMHIRTPQPRVEPSTEVIMTLVVRAAASLVIVAVLACWLKFAAGAKLADFGIVPCKVAGDIRIGLLAFLAVTVPAYAVMFGVSQLVPKNVVADPIPILLLGLTFGVLYYRTHRIVPSIALHMAFNAVGVFLALAASR